MKQKGFTLILVIILIAVLAVAGYFGYKYLRPTKHPITQTVTPSLSPSPTPLKLPCPSPSILPGLEMITQNTIILKKGVENYCNFNVYGEAGDIILVLDNSFSILQSSNEPFVVNVKGSVFKISVNSPGGACPYNNSDPSCTYTDEQSEKLQALGSKYSIVRVWKNKGGVFAINPQEIYPLYPEQYYLNNIVVLKSSPTKTFTDEEVNLWKSVFKSNVKVVKAGQ